MHFSRVYAEASRQVPASEYSRILVLRPRQNRALRRLRLQRMHVPRLKKETIVGQGQGLLWIVGKGLQSQETARLCSGY